MTDGEGCAWCERPSAEHVSQSGRRYCSERCSGLGEAAHASLDRMEDELKRMRQLLDSLRDHV